MKRKLASLLCLAALLTGPVNAASFEVYAPAGMAPTTDAGGVVTVDKAAMTVDFSGGEKDKLGLSPLGKTTVTYRVTNPTQTEQTITVALPYASPIEADRAIHPTLTVDGTPVEHKTYYGDLTADVILDTLGTGDALGNVLRECPQEMPNGTLYHIIPIVDLETFRVEELQIRFFVRHKFRTDDPIFYGGFGSMGTLEDGRVELTAWVYPEKDRSEWPVLTVFVPGDGTLEEIEVKDIDDYIGIRSPLGVEMTYETVENYSFREYVRQYMPETGPDWEQSYWALLMDMERDEKGLPTKPVQELVENMRYAQEYDRLAMAAIELTLAPGQTREVSATIGLSGSVDQPDDPETGHTTYTYTWQSAAARAWAGMGSLDLTIIPPKGMVIAADFVSAPGADGNYTAHWDSLPEEISFLMEPAPQPEQPEVSVPILPIMAGAAAVVVFAGILVLKRKK